MKADNKMIKKYLKENLSIRVNNKKIQLVLDNEVISESNLLMDENSGNDDLRASETLICEVCNQEFEKTAFCFNCSEPEKAVCLNCCNCFL